jgi:hypothetical protein
VTESESNLVIHARRELERIGEETYAVDWYLSVVRAFAAFGHSGGSAMVTICVLERLLRYQPLSALTDDPDEWIDRSEISGTPWWQNARDSRAMSHDGGKTYWLVDSDDTTLVHHSEPVASTTGH